MSIRPQFAEIDRQDSKGEPCRTILLPTTGGIILTPLYADGSCLPDERLDSAILKLRKLWPDQRVEISYGCIPHPILGGSASALRTAWERQGTHPTICVHIGSSDHTYHQFITSLHARCYHERLQIGTNSDWIRENGESLGYVSLNAILSQVTDKQHGLEHIARFPLAPLDIVQREWLMRALKVMAPRWGVSPENGGISYDGNSITLRTSGLNGNTMQMALQNIRDRAQPAQDQATLDGFISSLSQTTKITTVDLEIS